MYYKIVFFVDGVRVYCDPRDTDPHSDKAKAALSKFKNDLQSHPEWRSPAFCWVLETFDDVVTVCA